MDDDTRDFLNLVAFDNLNDLAAELRAIAEEIADTAPRLLAADQWACDRLSDLIPRLTAVAARLEE